MRGIVLNLVARILVFLLAPIGWVAAFFTISKANWDKYNFDIAQSKDQTANVQMQYFFNWLLITKDGYRFGNRYETISSVIGKNQLTNTLSKIGIVLNWILNKLDTNHSIKAIQNNLPS